MSARGEEYALKLKLRNVTTTPIRLSVCPGTIFEHIGWVHRQNLMVRHYKSLCLAPSASISVVLSVYCMNSTCGYATGQKMYLTEFYMPDKSVLASQARVWQHFDASFCPESKVKGKSKVNRCRIKKRKVK